MTDGYTDYAMEYYVPDESPTPPRKRRTSAGLHLLDRSMRSSPGFESEADRRAVLRHVVGLRQSQESVSISLSPRVTLARDDSRDRRDRTLRKRHPGRTYIRVSGVTRGRRIRVAHLSRGEICEPSRRGLTWITSISTLIVNADVTRESLRSRERGDSPADRDHPRAANRVSRRFDKAPLDCREPPPNFNVTSHRCSLCVPMQSKPMLGREPPTGKSNHSENGATVARNHSFAA